MKEWVQRLMERNIRSRHLISVLKKDREEDSSNVMRDFIIEEEKVKKEDVKQ